MLKKIASVCVLGIASIASTTASAAPEMNNFYYGVSLGFMNTDFLDRFEDLVSIFRSFPKHFRAKKSCKKMIL